MASIVIKDLTESIELDRQAMTAITGGARTRGRQPSFGRTLFRSDRIVNFPDFRGNASLDPDARLPGSTPRK
jgi:hypothetical protein